MLRATRERLRDATLLLAADMPLLQRVTRLCARYVIMMLICYTVDVTLLVAARKI